MSDLSLRLTITAIENATKALERIAKQTEDTNKRIGKSNEYWLNKDKREQEKHEHWKTNLVEREEQKRIKLAEKEAKDKRKALLQMEQDFRTSAQRLALYTTAPAAIMSTLGVRAFMEYENQQKRIKMNFQENSQDMEKFITDYAQSSAFSINDLVSLTTTLKANSKALGIQSPAEIKSLTTTVGNTLLAFTNNSEERARFMLQFQQVLGRGEAMQSELNIFNEVGMNFKKFWAEMGNAPKGEKEQFTTQELLQILKYMEGTKEAQIAILENAKSFTQAWDASKESINQILVGYGKTLNKQFDLTDNTKIFAGLLQKIGEKLKSDNENLTKGMASYLTMLTLTVAPTLMLVGHWRKISFLIGESNMKGGVLKDRLIMTAGAMSGLYLATVDWGNLMKQYEEEGFLKTTLSNLDKVIALMMVGGALYKAIKGLYTFWIAKEARLTSLAVIRAAATNPKNLIAIGGAAAAIGGTYLIANALGAKSSEEINQDMGYDPLKRMFDNENINYASGKNIEMLANLQSQPKVEVINNINVDKSGNVSVETKTKDKNTYISPYSAPVMSDFSLGY